MLTYYLGLAWRRCVKSPGIVTLVVLTMAVGVAACMTAFAIFHAIEGQPLPGISNRLYVVTMDARQEVSKSGSAYASPDSLLSFRDAKALVDANRAASQAAFARTDIRVANPDGKQAQPVVGLMAYGPVLRELGVPMRFGRSWTEIEQRSHAPVVVIDSKLAETLFGTPDAVGRSVQMNKRLFRVIGITAPWRPRTAFFLRNSSIGADQVIGSNFQLFVPVGSALDAGVGPDSSGECAGGAAITLGAVNVQNCRWLEMWVSLPTPAHMKAYSHFLTAYADTQHDAGRFVYPPHAKLYGTQSWMALNHVIPSDVTLNVILAGAFLVLCIINVAGLLTARFRRRRADVAIRRALGATLWQVFAQHLVESGLLGLMGGALALPLTLLGMWIVRQQPASYAPAAQFNPVVFIGLVVLSLVVGMLVGVFPAWRISRLPPATQVKA